MSSLQILDSEPLKPPLLASWSYGEGSCTRHASLRGNGPVYLLAGGGTGGHLFPGIALAEAFRRRQPDATTLFVGCDRPIEHRIVETFGLSHRALTTASFSLCRRRPDQFLWRNWKALHEAKQLMTTLKPRLVIGLGGFASVPTVWAAHRAGIPIILLEQNAIPGRATCWLSRLARMVCTTFSESTHWLPRQTPTLVCGNPVRQTIMELEREPVPERNAVPQLLVLGGSLGAEGLNSALMDLVRHHPELRRWKIVHQTGPRQREAVQATYRDVGQPADVADFFEDLPSLYRQADIVISRAGATTLSELACAGRATILVPFPKATDDHQRANAEAYSQQGAAVVVEQSTASPQTAERLWASLQPLLQAPLLQHQLAVNARSMARPDAADRIIDLIESEQFAAA